MRLKTGAFSVYATQNGSVFSVCDSKRERFQCMRLKTEAFSIYFTENENVLDAFY